MTTLKTKVTKVFYIFVAILYLISFIISIIAYALGNRLVHGIFKGLVMPSIMGYTYLSWAGPRDKKYALLQLAFFLAWIGDMIIALPREYTIKIGGGFFLFQHFIYIWLNLSAKGTKASIWKTLYWGLPSIAYVALFSICYWANRNVIERILLVFYSFVLGSSFYTVFYREARTKFNYTAGILGFTFFVLSDIILFLDNFVFKITDLEASSVLLTYYIAQSLICRMHVGDSQMALTIS